MMTDEQPIIGKCGFCSEGSLRIQRCHNCYRPVAACEACGLMWEEIAELRRDTNLSSDSQHPCCPACGLASADFELLTKEQAEEEGFGCFLEEA